MMHPSYFLLVAIAETEPGRDLALSADASEWLFHVGFWEAFNKKHQTLFAQYEEDVLPATLTAELISDVSVLIDQVAGQFEGDTHFLYGWDASKNELYCSVSNKSLAESLIKLRVFLERAKGLNLEVYCQF